MSFPRTRESRHLDSCFRRSDIRILSAQKNLPFRLRPEAVAVGDEFDGAIYVGAIQVGGVEPVQHLGAGVTEGVVHHRRAIVDSDSHRTVK